MAEWVTAGKVRSTPKGVWNSSMAYTVLDMVSNEDYSTYYIAKQSVPAGTQLTNTSYWDVVVDISNLEVSTSSIITDEEIDTLSSLLESK